MVKKEYKNKKATVKRDKSKKKSPTSTTRVYMTMMGVTTYKGMKLHYGSHYTLDSSDAKFLIDQGYASCCEDCGKKKKLGGKKCKDCP